MSPEQMMQFIVEKAGERWHTRVTTGEVRFICSCGIAAIHNDYTDEHSNPSPTDLKELMRLARKLNFHCEIDVDGNGQSQISLHGNNLLSVRPSGQSIEGLPFAEALLDALYKAVGG